MDHVNKTKYEVEAVKAEIEHNELLNVGFLFFQTKSREGLSSTTYFSAIFSRVSMLQELWGGKSKTVSDLKSKETESDQRVAVTVFLPM